MKSNADRVNEALDALNFVEPRTITSEDRLERVKDDLLALRDYLEGDDEEIEEDETQATAW